MSSVNLPKDKEASKYLGEIVGLAEEAVKSQPMAYDAGTVTLVSVLEGFKNAPLTNCRYFTGSEIPELSAFDDAEYEHHI